MSQIKIGSTVVYIPPKSFTEFSITVGTIVGREKIGPAAFNRTRYQISWGSDRAFNCYDDVTLSGAPFHIFSDQKKALAFILANSK
jgi:hypothetical protein